VCRQVLIYRSYWSPPSIKTLFYLVRGRITLIPSTENTSHIPKRKDSPPFAFPCLLLSEARAPSSSPSSPTVPGEAARSSQWPGVSRAGTQMPQSPVQIIPRVTSLEEMGWSVPFFFRIVFGWSEVCALCKSSREHWGSPPKKWTAQRATISHSPRIAGFLYGWGKRLGRRTQVWQMIQVDESMR
jgi:hypothetical protein